MDILLEELGLELASEGVLAFLIPFFEAFYAA